MRMSNMLICTMREVPGEAEIVSHKLMLRSGMIRKMASGVYNFMPLGIRVLKKIENIVREEMNNAGAQEFLASALIPSELWKESGRWEVFGPEMFKLKDRNGREFCLGPTHEEVFTDIARNEIKSYKQLPLNLYQIQTKYRDERRPRFGAMRSREFIMKDAYSFDKDLIGLDSSYIKMYETYKKIFNRCGLDAKAVEADSGAMGGAGSSEFMIQSDVGEDDVVFCTECNYAANMEKATSISDSFEKSEPIHKNEKTMEKECTQAYPNNEGNIITINEELKPCVKVETPSARTINELVGFFNTTSKKFAKTLIFKADNKIVAVMVRGDREVNETKVINAIGGVVEFEMADADSVMKATNAEVGFAGPIDIKVDMLLVDHEVSHMKDFIVGANDTGYHYKDVNYGRDFFGNIGDYRNVALGDLCPRCGGIVTISRGIEVGHIFKLGTKYSEAMGANFIDERGETKPLIMGCYGIGLNRTMAAIVEQHFDEKGIVWPLSVAPFEVVIVPVVTKNAEQMQVAENLYNGLKKIGIDALIDDRDERAGVKFKDADLIGIPIRITIGKNIGDGKVEFKLRRNEELELITIDSVLDRVREEFHKY